MIRRLECFGCNQIYNFTKKYFLLLWIVIYIPIRFEKSVFYISFKLQPAPHLHTMRYDYGFMGFKKWDFCEGVGDIDIAVYSDCLYLFLSSTK